MVAAASGHGSCSTGVSQSTSSRRVQARRREVSHASRSVDRSIRSPGRRRSRLPVPEPLPRLEGGDPTAASAALLKGADVEQSPLRVLSGAAPPHMVKNLYAERLQT
ncbi:hypothetical protein [Streptomyces sp. NPDC003393]